jgi:hypothetical protein
MQIPALDNILEVSTEHHPAEFHVSIDHVDPKTLVDFRHQAEGLNQFLVFVDELVFEMVGLQKRLDGHFGVDLRRGLVRDPEEEEKNVLEVYY